MQIRRHYLLEMMMHGKYSRISQDPCSSIWFLWFIQGCKKRMGKDWRPNRAISNSLMLGLLATVESYLSETENSLDHHITRLKAGA